MCEKEGGDVPEPGEPVGVAPEQSHPPLLFEDVPETLVEQLRRIDPPRFTGGRDEVEVTGDFFAVDDCRVRPEGDVPGEIVHPV